MKTKRIKVTLDTIVIETIVPGASALEYLPRKKKKSLKKKISNRLIEIAHDDSLREEAIAKLNEL